MTTDEHRPEPDIAFEFGNDPAAPRAARHALEPLFPHGEALAEEVSLVASEFVSNVVMHTSAGGYLHAWHDNPVRLEVHDHDPRLPTIPDEDDATAAKTIGGRGLGIVDDLADQWGAQLQGDGKTLWAEFRRPSTATAGRA